MLKKWWFKPFIMGVITYFIITITLSMFGANTFINRSALLAIITLVGSVIIHFYDKKQSHKRI